jgi:hypothetical protein
VAWRKQQEPVHIEPPGWYRIFRPEDWDTPDGQEQRMIDGSLSQAPWPAGLHEIHSHRRWMQAKHEYRRAHPDLAEQEFADLIRQVADHD